MEQVQVSIEIILALIIRSLEMEKYENALEIAKSTIKQLEERKKSANQALDQTADKAPAAGQLFVVFE